MLYRAKRLIIPGVGKARIRKGAILQKHEVPEGFEHHFDVIEEHQVPVEARPKPMTLEEAKGKPVPSVDHKAQEARRKKQAEAKRKQRAKKKEDSFLE